MVRRFKKAIIERALGGELTHHLGYAAGAAKPEDTTNHRNGTSGKTVLMDDGPLPLDVPRDRAGTFEPRLIGKHERRFTGFDDKVIALYARGLTVREIQAFLAEMYAVERLARSDQHRHRRSGRGGHGLASAPARTNVSSRVLRCPPRQDPGRSGGPEQGGLSGPCRLARRHPRRSWGFGSSRPKAPSSG